MSRLLIVVLILPLMGAGECAERQLTFGGQDEDGSLLAASNGRYYFAWISARAGTTDVYIKESPDGESWGDPWLAIRRDASYHPLTTDHLNFLTEDEPGVFRLTGGHLGDPQIWTATTTDIYNWPETIAVTDTPELKYAINGIQRHPDGDHWVVYSALVGGRWDIYIQHMGDDSRVDQPPVPITVGSGSLQHIFPYFRITADGRFVVAWIGVDAQPLSILNVDVYLGPTTDVYTATSLDGSSWSTPTFVSTDVFAGGPVLDSLPALLDGPGGLYLIWLSQGLGIGEPDICSGVTTAPIVPLIDGVPQLALDQWRHVDEPGYSVRSVGLASGKWMLAYVKQTRIRPDGTPFDADDPQQCAEGTATTADNYYRLVPNFLFPRVFP